MQYTAIFILGLIIGSFLGLCIYRIPKGQSVVFPSSYCPGCRSRLKIRHMVPVLSYIFLKGRCSFCKSKISPIYPLVELLTAVLFTLLLHRFGPGMDFLKFSLLGSILIVVGFIDYKWQIIPDRLVVAGIVLAIFFVLVDREHSPVYYLTGAVTGGGILLAVGTISKGGMGGGDIKLMTVIGMFLGWQYTLIVLYLSVVIGGMVSTLLLLTGKKGRKDTVPFGPFLSGAAIAAFCFGGQLISLYQRLI